MAWRRGFAPRCSPIERDVPVGRGVHDGELVAGAVVPGLERHKDEAPRIGLGVRHGYQRDPALDLGSLQAAVIAGASSALNGLRAMTPSPSGGLGGLTFAIMAEVCRVAAGSERARRSRPFPTAPRPLKRRNPRGRLHVAKGRRAGEGGRPA